MSTTTIADLTERDASTARRQAATLIERELTRASERGLELRWEPIRAALTILRMGPAKWSDLEPMF